MDQMIENIVAFRFDVTKVVAKSKISQNRERKDFLSVKEAMDSSNKIYLENAMGRFVEDQD